jgi:hypothetical protein
MRVRLQDPVLKVSLGIRFAVMLGIILLMGARPGLWQSAAIVVVSLVLGLLLPLLASRRAPSTLGQTFERSL